MKKIKKVTVLGSGIMGMGIAAHLANLGFEVRLLDIVQPDLSPAQKEDPSARNAFATNAILKALATDRNPPFVDKSCAASVSPGNFEDDISKIGDSDWVIEVVVENLAIKQQIFEKVDQYRTPGTLVTSNTSGIPIHLMAEGRSDDFRIHFCGTHFFNPVRYMRLLEIIPGKETLPEIVDFLMTFGSKTLEKQTVLCKDTPGFIANRIGYFSGNLVTLLTDKYELTVEEVDGLTGPAIGRPNSGTFRLRDLTGVDLGIKFRESMTQNLLPVDEFAQQIKDIPIPDYWKYLVDNKFWGNKTGQGFYKKTRDEKGDRLILAFNLKTYEYAPAKTPNLDSLKAVATMENLEDRLKTIIDYNDKGGQFLAEYFGQFFAYMSNRIPEIADHLYSVDDALKTGFNWQKGAFEIWDIYGIQNGIDLAKKYGFEVADWVQSFVNAGNTTFYKKEDRGRTCYNPRTGAYEVI